VNFKEYLVTKKIDAEALVAADPGMYEEWQKMFNLVSPASFTAQKLFLINSVRRRFPLKIEISSPVTGSNASAKVAKPVFKPKLKSDVTHEDTESWWKMIT
jgi:hypothetical protein